MKKLVRSRAPLLVLVAVGTMVAWLSIAPQAWSAADLVGGACDCGTWFHCNGERMVDCPAHCDGPYAYRMVCKGYCAGHVQGCNHAESLTCYAHQPNCYNYYNVRCEN